MSKSRKKGRVPLFRALSKLGLASRIEARIAIESGRVKVHGSIETNPERAVNPDTAHIQVDGVKAEKSHTRVILFHKPKGVLTTKRDPEGRKTIYDLLPEQFATFHAVGRLDMHTSGLLLLTNDTKFSSFMTDPKSGIERVYIVGVEGEALDSTLQKMKSGVMDQGERLSVEGAKLLKVSGKESLIELVLTEGKNREIRRLCAALGHDVRSLKRIQYGSYFLDSLKTGEWIEV
ncbi:MAG: rRNA pseudouridine synthase [Bdellovibrionales bacterium]|nr:rRNA pseudouridine synthase [Bdellovibrionales bacterium]